MKNQITETILGEYVFLLKLNNFNKHEYETALQYCFSLFTVSRYFRLLAKVLLTCWRQGGSVNDQRRWEILRNKTYAA